MKLTKKQLSMLIEQYLLIEYDPKAGQSMELYIPGQQIKLTKPSRYDHALKDSCASSEEELGTWPKFLKWAKENKRTREFAKAADWKTQFIILKQFWDEVCLETSALSKKQIVIKPYKSGDIKRKILANADIELKRQNNTKSKYVFKLDDDGVYKLYNSETGRFQEDERYSFTKEHGWLAAEIAAGFTPAAPLIDLKDLTVAIDEGDYLVGVPLALLGFIPGVSETRKIFQGADILDTSRGIASRRGAINPGEILKKKRKAASKLSRQEAKEAATKMQAARKNGDDAIAELNTFLKSRGIKSGEDYTLLNRIDDLNNSLIDWKKPWQSAESASKMKKFDSMSELTKARTEYAKIVVDFLKTQKQFSKKVRKQYIEKLKEIEEQAHKSLYAYIDYKHGEQAYIAMSNLEKYGDDFVAGGKLTPKMFQDAFHDVKYKVKQKPEYQTSYQTADGRPETYKLPDKYRTRKFKTTKPGKWPSSPRLRMRNADDEITKVFFKGDKDGFRQWKSDVIGMQHEKKILKKYKSYIQKIEKK